MGPNIKKIMITQLTKLMKKKINRYYEYLIIFYQELGVSSIHGNSQTPLL